MNDKIRISLLLAAVATFATAPAALAEDPGLPPPPPEGETACEAPAECGPELNAPEGEAAPDEAAPRRRQSKGAL